MPILLVDRISKDQVAVVAHKVFLIILISIGSSGTSIIEAKVANAFACLFCLRGTCLKLGMRESSNKLSNGSPIRQESNLP